MSEGDQLEIAGFRIDSEIGRGGMGVVYVATQTFPERRVALKVLSPELAGDTAFRERFIRESNAAASTEHPNIVPVYAAGEDDGRLYLAMRFIEGTDLRSLLEHEGPLSPERAARICAQVADALQAAHDRGLVHRDVKPGNVLLDGNEHTYLSDFGLIRPTRVSSELTKTGQFMGTLEYVAPEQIRGDPVDGRADLYSLGCVLYECLIGTPPFRREHELATLSAHLEDPPPRPSAVRPETPKALDEIVLRAMAKRPEDRFATAAEMAGSLRGSLTPMSSNRPHGRLALAIVLVVVLVAIVGGVLAARQGDGTDPAEVSGPSGTGTAHPNNSLLQVDVDTGSVLTTSPGMPVGVGSFPAIETGEGGVWVYATGILVRVDPGDPARLERVSIGSSLGVDSIALAERIVWTSLSQGVGRVSASDLQILDDVPLSEPFAAAREIYVAAVPDALFAVTGSGALARIDPQTAEPTGEVNVGGATGIAAGFDAAWIADDLHGTVTRVDADTLTVDPPIQIPGSIDDLEAGVGAVWVLDSVAGVVTPIDPGTGDVGSPVRLGNRPTSIAAGSDVLWAANHGDGTLSSIDPTTGAVTATLEIGAPVATLAVDGSRIWVTIATTTPG